MSAGKDFSDDELDRLLRRARWPEPRDEQTARLRRHWRQIQVARRRKRFALAGLAAAAGVLAVATILARRPAEDAPKLVSPAAQRPGGQRPPSEPAIATRKHGVTEPKHSAAVASRDPNLYERVVLMAAAKERGRASTADRRDPEELTKELIDVLAHDPGADVDEGVERLRRHLPRCERLLWKAVRSGSDQQRSGAARLLARIGTPRSLPVLAELARDRATRETATLGLARLAGDQQLGQLAAGESDAHLRRRLVEMLLARGTPEAVGRYLDFVAAPPTRIDALSVLGDMEDPPAGQLLAYLENPRHSVRLAAALALARVADPAVVERLCASVWGIGRQEALIALLLSRSDKAAGCLSRARENLYLVASVQAAEQRLRSLRIPEGRYLP